MGFDYDWNIRVFTYEYYSVLDIVSQLGGIGATIKIVLTSATPLIILKFMSEFVGMLKRQANQRVRLMRLKDIKSNRHEIEEKIRG